MIKQSPRCGDQDVDAFTQGVDLRIDADPAIDHGGVYWQIPAIGAHTLRDLTGQLAGWCQYQGANAALSALGFVA